MNIGTLIGRAVGRISKSWRTHPLLMGVMMGLTFNLSLLPALQPASRANADPAERAVAGPDVGIDGVYATQKHVWQSLFRSDWDSNNWTYPLDKEVVEPNDYSGANHLGERFTLRVSVWSPVNLNELDLTPEQKTWVHEHQVRTGGVIGTLTTEMGSVEVAGTAVRLVQDGIEDIRFLMEAEVPAAGLAIENAKIAQQWLDEANAEMEVARARADQAARELVEAAQAVQYAQQQVGNPNCQGCYDTYNQAVAQANAAYQIAVNAATTTKNALDAAAQVVYNAAVAAAQANQASCLLQAAAAKTLCTIGLIGCGFFVLGCLAICIAGFAAWVAVCISNYNAAMTAAQTTLAATLAANLAAYNAAITAASLTLNNAINAAAAALQACLAACGGAPAPIVPVRQAVQDTTEQ
ncbi:MAG TPA: hypothetical protein VG797_09960 [Phycisphaerales bacterium]|nr:hypothetical protein [Phycisphaerales bacterium]